MKGKAIGKEQGERRRGRLRRRSLSVFRRHQKKLGVWSKSRVGLHVCPREIWSQSTSWQEPTRALGLDKFKERIEREEKNAVPQKGEQGLLFILIYFILGQLRRCMLLNQWHIVPLPMKHKQNCMNAPKKNIAKLTNLFQGHGRCS